MSTPFDSIDFSGSSEGDPTQEAALPAGSSVSNDEIIKLLSTLGGNGPSRLTNPNAPPDILSALKGVGGQGGVDRVNADSANTGAIAYKDSKGQTVLTNVAKDAATGKDTRLPIGPTEAKMIPGTNIPAPKEQTYAANPEVALGIYKGLQDLQATKDPNEARVIYNSLQQSMTNQEASLKQQAYDFAEQKLSIPQMLMDIEKSRQTDRISIGYYDGRGDSPVTQALLTRLQQARAFADNEAKIFLEKNPTVLTLINSKKQADDVMKRVEAADAQRINMEASKALTLSNAKIMSGVEDQRRDEDRKQKKEEAAATFFNGLSTEQIARVNLWHASDLAQFDDSAKLTDPSYKLKVVDLITQNAKKNKDYEAALGAQGPVNLLGLAIGGNRWARQAAIADEVSKTGVPAKEVDAKITELEKALDPGTFAKILSNRVPDKTKRETMLGDLNAAKFSADPTKKAEATNTKVAILMQWLGEKQTATFTGDTSSWGLTDPMFLAAVDKARKNKNGAAPDVGTTLSAYIGESTGAERLAKVEEFRKAIHEASGKKSLSMFGQPDYTAAEQIAVKEIINHGWFSDALQAPGKLIVKAAKAIDARETGVLQLPSIYSSHVANTLFGSE